MKKNKKILSTLIKILVGLASFGVIYFRLENDLTPERLDMIIQSASSISSVLVIAFCFLLIPLNWGIEAYKWQLITAPVEAVSYGTASRSVYSGVCLGNLAPGKATAFLAKIIYFDIENRPQITVLHFINGLFQLAVTVLAGFAALAFHVQNIAGSADWMIYATGTVGSILIGALVVAVFKIDYLLNVISKKISKDKNAQDFHYQFSPPLLLKLFSLSVIRYAVFFTQFALLLSIFHTAPLGTPVLTGIALYFLVTTTLPMISVLEAAIRAAVALVVFREANVSDAVLALTSVLLWLINIIFPSVAGYYFLLRQNFNFKLFRSKG